MCLMMLSELAELRGRCSASSSISHLLWMEPAAFIKQGCDSEPPLLDSASLWSSAG
jgi:hypothetical protein